MRLFLSHPRLCEPIGNCLTHTVTPPCSLGLWVERRRWVAPYAGSLGSLFEGPLRGEALMRAPLELRNQAIKQAEGGKGCRSV